MIDEMNFTLYLSKPSQPEFAECKIFQMERKKMLVLSRFFGTTTVILGQEVHNL